MNSPSNAIPKTPAPDSTEATPPIVLWIGLDWADKLHHVVARPPSGGPRLEQSLAQQPEAFELWLQSLRQKHPTGHFGVCVEQKRGPVIAALLKFDFVQIYPINPRALSDFRAALALSGAKSDPGDADLLAELGLKHHDRLRALLPQDPVTRELTLLTEHRRGLVDDRTAFHNQLTANLKAYYPLALDLLDAVLDGPMALDFLRRWPNLAALQRAKPQQIRSFFYAHNSRSQELIEERLKAIAAAKPLTLDPAIIEPHQLRTATLLSLLAAAQKSIDAYDRRISQVFQIHPYAPIFAALPGAGPALAPRLAVLFGTRLSNWTKSDELLSFTGVAPVKRQSGKQRTVHFRWARPLFFHQSVVEFAKCSLPQCEWANLLYESLVARGKSRWMALRVVAFKWLRILWRCWKDQVAYSEDRYVRSLQKRGLKLYESLYQTAA